jgi:hypothetical protein
MTEPEIKALMRDLADCITQKTGSLFMLVVFDDPGVAQYISNAKREDCIKAMEETAQRFRNKETIERA